MSKKIGVPISLITIFLVIYYLAIHASQYETVTIGEYMLPYFTRGSTYFLIYTIFVFPFLFFFKIHVFEPLIYLRLGKNIFYYILRNGIILSICISIYIFMSFIISGFIFGYKNDIELSWMKYLCLLFMFVFSCYTISNVGYYLSGKTIFGMLSIFGVNYLILVVTYAVDMGVSADLDLNALLNAILQIYIFCTALFGLMYLYKKSETKECLQSKSI